MIRIPKQLFNDLLQYFCAPPLDEDILDDLAMRITTMLEEKLNAMVKRDLYTKSKTALTSEEREAARQKYLDAAGILSPFRWSEGNGPNKNNL